MANLTFTYTLTGPEEVMKPAIVGIARQTGYQDRVINPDFGKDADNPGPRTIPNPLARDEWIKDRIGEWLRNHATNDNVQQASAAATDAARNQTAAALDSVTSDLKVE